MENLHEAIRAWAKGIYPTEAGAELLCRTDWARRLYGSGWVEVDDDGWLDGHRQAIASPRVGEFLTHAGYLSGGERRQLMIIASFLGQLVDGNNPETLYETLSGTDHSFIRLVQSAVGHAAGMHESGGNPLPWPDEDEEAGDYDPFGSQLGQEPGGGLM